jgi:Uma2 family endonuclease
MLFALDRIQIPPGQHVILRDVSWQEFEQILVELGDRHAARIAYQNGHLEIMTPLPEHEFGKEIISDLVKALLEEMDIEFRCLGSTTFKKGMRQGLEPDQCFYLENEVKIRGKKRIDLAIDPPPDLALEVDITSRTYPEIYAALGVPELWRFEKNQLQINCLVEDTYQIVEHSPHFPDLNLTQVIPQYLEKSQVQGRNQTLREFRQWLRGQRKNSHA